MSEHGRAPNEWAVSLAQRASMRYGPTPTTIVVRHGARTSQARVLRILLRESVRWRDREGAHVNTDFSLEAAAGMSGHVRSPRERAIPLAQWVLIGHGPTLTSATGRARAASTRSVLPPDRERARAVALFYLRTCATELLAGVRGWHVRARPFAEGEGRLAGAVGFHGAWVDSNQRGGAHTRCKRACCASSRERELARSGAFFLAHMRN